LPSPSTTALPDWFYPPRPHELTVADLTSPFGKVGVMEGDDEVDAKADDFINRFKQQLKLQRLDSIIWFKDASNRGNFSLRACSEAIVLFSYVVVFWFECGNERD
jgi:hypothetical protein